MELERFIKDEFMVKMLNNEGLFTAEDVLNNFPHRYINYDVIKNDGIYFDKILIRGELLNSIIIEKKYRKNLSSISFKIKSLGIIVDVIIFNRNFYKSKIINRKSFYLYGKYDYYKKQMVADNIYFKRLPTIETIYPKKISSFKSIVQSILDNDEFAKKIDIIPEELRNKYKLVDEKTMYYYAHLPQNITQVKEFYRRIKFQELFMFELMLEYKKLHRMKEYKNPKNYDIKKIKDFISTIPFELTDDQKKCVNDIFLDLKSSHAANRLIQGDVGSGKTVVSAISMYGAITAGYQATLMAPTEILANQHYLSLCKLFNNVIKIEVLTSSVKGKKREAILEKLKNGEIDLLIGTHALITEDVCFKNLGIVIVDEQHRFGVVQRLALKYKGENPDIIFLSATPIPRTLAISLFGDMDLSIIKTKPNGRRPVVTRYYSDEQKEKGYEIIDSEIKKGHQAYVISPLIENENDKDLNDINKIYEELKNRFDYKIGILHGKMKPKDKDDIMNCFKNGEIDILLSTTVVEVGVDVKNATVILIYDGERFGLAQLHQLRGRVGRNDYDNYCIILSKTNDKERLKIIESVYDGFKLAEEDLRLRGPGDFFGSKQSGMPTFKVANLIDDFKILEVAKIEASSIINNIYDKKYEYLLKYLNEGNTKIE